MDSGKRPLNCTVKMPDAAERFTVEGVQQIKFLAELTLEGKPVTRTITATGEACETISNLIAQIVDRKMDDAEIIVWINPTEVRLAD